MSLLFNIRRDPLKFFGEFGDRNGGHAWMSLGGKRILFTSDATALQHVVQKNAGNYIKSDFNDVLRPLLGDGIFLSEGGLWMSQRHATAPAFSGRYYDEYCSAFNEKADAMLADWAALAKEGRPVDVVASTSRLALGVALQTLFHEESEQALNNMKDAMGVMLGLAEDRIWSLANLPMGLVLKLPKYRKTMKLLDEITDELVHQHKRNPDAPHDLLSRLIELNGKDTKEDRRLLRDNTLSLLLAGYETTANSLAWTFYEVARNPDVYAQLQREVDGVVGPGREVSMQDLGRLQYVKQCFDESLRLYPPVWTTSRTALADDVIPLDDGSRLAVPKGSYVMLCLYSLHRNKAYWKGNTAEYIPDRFSREEKSGRPEYAWKPFLAGPRVCLGERFATAEAMVALAKSFHRYDIRLAPGQGPLAPIPMITLRPPPFLIELQERTHGGPPPPRPPSSQGPAHGGGCPFH